MGKKKKEAVAVDGNGAAVAKSESKFTKFKRRKRILFLCFNFVYILAYMAYTAYTLISQNAGIFWLPYAFGGFIVVYLVLFVISLAMAKNERRQENAVKDYKSGLKIIKKLLKLINLALAIAVVANTVAIGGINLFSLILSCVSVLYVVIQIFREIRKMVKRRKKLKIKEQKEDCDKRFMNDVKNIWYGKDKGGDEKTADSVDEVAAAPVGESGEESEFFEESSASVPEAEVVASGGEEAIAEDEEVKAPVAASEKKKSAIEKKFSEFGKVANKKFNEVKKTATDKFESVKKSATEKAGAVKDTAERAKKISERAKEYYDERKQIGKKPAKTSKDKSSDKSKNK